MSLSDDAINISSVMIESKGNAHNCCKDIDFLTGIPGVTDWNQGDSTSDMDTVGMKAITREADILCQR